MSKKKKIKGHRKIAFLLGTVGKIQKAKLDKFVGFKDFKLHSTRHISGTALDELGASSDIIKTT